MSEAVQTYIFESIDLELTRESVEVSVFDGTVLRGYRYRMLRSGTGRKKRDKRSDHPLLCLPAPLCSTAQQEPFILELMQQTGSPGTVISFDFRGRGRSDRSDPETYSLPTEAADLISVCDALGLHEPDILATGESVFSLLEALPARPSLARKVVLHDALPEFDPVGIVRMAQLWRGVSTPDNWGEASNVLKQATGSSFPNFQEEDWDQLSRLVWEDAEGKPVKPFDDYLEPRFRDFDVDIPRPSNNAAFKLLKSDSILLVAGERSSLVTTEFISKACRIQKSMQVHLVTGQGHWPIVSGEETVAVINQFLIDVPSAISEE